MESYIEDTIERYSKMSVADFQNISRTKADRERLSKRIVAHIEDAYQEKLIDLGSFSFIQLGTEDEKTYKKEKNDFVAKLTEQKVQHTYIKELEKLPDLNEIMFKYADKVVRKMRPSSEAVAPASSSGGRKRIKK